MQYYRTFKITMNNSNENTEVQDKSNSRRQFIFKAAAGTAVATLTSKTAWAGGAGGGTGCSVSGNLSGNLSQARDCSTAQVQGKSPSQWKRSLEKRPAKNEIWKNVFGMGRNPEGLSSGNSNLLEFLPDGSAYVKDGINEALVTAYLNAKYGKYPLAPGVTANDYVVGLYDSYKNFTFSQSDIIDAVRDTYDAD